MKLGNDVYIKGDPRAVEQFAQLDGEDPALSHEIGRRIGNKWLKGPTDRFNFDELSLDSLSDSLAAEATYTGTPQPREIHGQPVVEVSATDGSSLDVAAVGKPYPVHVAKGPTADDSSTAQGTLDSYGAPVNAQAPSDYLDISSMPARPA